jgi:hypothetical protein
LVKLFLKVTADLKIPDLSQRLEEWQDHYNQYRVHRSLSGRTPWDAWFELPHAVRR